MRRCLQPFLAGLAIVSTGASLGCTDAQFASVNAQLGQLRDASAKMPEPQVVTAVAAAALGGMEVAKAMLAGIAAASPAAPRPLRLLAFEPGRNKTERIDANGVTGSVRYNSEALEFGAIHTDVDEIIVTTSGYNLFCEGVFDYTPGQRGVAKSTFTASLSGVLKHGQYLFLIPDLSLAAADPLPKDAEKIGKIVLYRPYVEGGTFQDLLVEGRIGTKAGKLDGELALYASDGNKAKGLPLGPPVPLTGF
ncbi:MAG: hypothetical protein VKS61_10530 [Candidatus Sericytochromatia bacterium]|nr:hypothetical protein [Candidatus Sericytochromatia bacterium]